MVDCGSPRQPERAAADGPMRERLTDMNAAADIAVLGIGNILLTDEGVGVHAVNRFRAVHAGASLRLIDGGTLGPALLDCLDGADGLIVIDAARLGLPPGSVRCFHENAWDALSRSGSRTVHELGLKDLLDIARLSGTLPSRRALIAVEPACIDWGTALSPSVAASLDRVVAMVSDLAEQWRTVAEAPA